MRTRRKTVGRSNEERERREDRNKMGKDSK